MGTVMEERVKAMLGGNVKPEMKQLMTDLGPDFQFPEWKHRVNKLDSCSSEDGAGPVNPGAGGYAQAPQSTGQSPGGKAQLTFGFLPKQSLLHEMVGIDSLEKASRQLDKGTDVNIKDCMGETPLFWAVSAEAVDYLVREGAEVDARNTLCDCSAFYKFACQGKHRPMKALARHLRKVGKLEEFLNDPASVTKRTPLHAAAHNGFTQTVKELLAMGADRDLQDYMNKTALDLAKSRGFDEIVTLLE
eukprot:TRINITY_DN3411_c0_g2_i1.p1 TRINITY_DN3411_c0_g2~~TRINITY_DN3411_c0_g2_i1.p1  ORF type:complete len:246 (-),score=53.13 TRINITY_DN3411_c0_g2_i1:64-801(-)